MVHSANLLYNHHTPLKINMETTVSQDQRPVSTTEHLNSRDQTLKAAAETVEPPDQHVQTTSAIAVDGACSDCIEDRRHEHAAWCKLCGALPPTGAICICCGYTVHDSGEPVSCGACVRPECTLGDMNIKQA
jgi:ferredoxin